MRQRKLLVLGAVAAIAGTAWLVMSTATPVDAGIAGSDHDFSSKNWSGGEICIVCHTPHGATVITDAPLWNHATTNNTFTPYNSNSMNAATGQPDGASKLCLSCHDGTVAIDSFGGNTGSVNMSGDKAVGADDLDNDHPISFTYDAALASLDGELVDPTAADSNGPGRTIDGDLLIGSKMQCSSCHDVHNKAGINKLLVKSNASSALCLTCHVK